MAATSKPIFTTVVLVFSSRLFSQFTNSWTLETMARILGMRISPMEMASSERADFKMVICPLRLSCIVSAICFATPVEFSNAS